MKKMRFLVPAKWLSRKKSKEKQGQSTPDKAHYQALDNSDGIDITGRTKAPHIKPSKLKKNNKFSVYGEMLHFPVEDKAQYLDHAWHNLIEMAASYNLKKEPKGWWIFSNRAKRFKDQMSRDFGPDAYARYEKAMAMTKDASGAPVGKLIRYRRNIHALSNAIGFLAYHRKDDGTFPETIKDEKHGIKEDLPAFKAFELYFTKVIETARVRAKGLWLGLVSRLYSFFELVLERGSQYTEYHNGAGTFKGELGNAKASKKAEEQKSELLKEQVGELEAKLRKTEKEIEDLQEKLEEQQPLVDQSTASHVAIAEGAERDKKTIDALKLENEQHQEKINELEASLCDQKKTTEDLTGQLAKVNTNAQQLQGKTDQLTQQVTELTAARNTLLVRLQGASKKAQLAEDKHAELSEQLGPVQEKATRVEKAEQAAEDSAAKAVQLQGEKEELSLAAAQALDKQTVAEDALKAEQTKVADLSNQIERLTSQVAELEKLNSSQTHAMGESVEAVQQEKDRIVSELEKKLEAFKGKFEELNKTAADALEQKAAANQKWKSAQVEVSDLRSQLEVQKDSVAEIQHENFGIVQRMQAEMDRLQGEIDRLTAAVEQAGQDTSSKIKVHTQEYQSIMKLFIQYMKLSDELIKATGVSELDIIEKAGEMKCRAYFSIPAMVAKFKDEHEALHSAEQQAQVNDEVVDADLREEGRVQTSPQPQRKSDVQTLVEHSVLFTGQQGADALRAQGQRTQDVDALLQSSPLPSILEGMDVRGFGN